MCKQREIIVIFRLTVLYINILYNDGEKDQNNNEFHMGG